MDYIFKMYFFSWSFSTLDEEQFQSLTHEW